MRKAHNSTLNIQNSTLPTATIQHSTLRTAHSATFDVYSLPLLSCSLVAPLCFRCFFDRSSIVLRQIFDCLTKDERRMNEGRTKNEREPIENRTRIEREPIEDFLSFLDDCKVTHTRDLPVRHCPTQMQNVSQMFNLSVPLILS